MTRIRTQRLDLVASTIPLLEAEGESRGERFAALLGAEVADSWPPPLNDESTRKWMIRLLEQQPGEEGWGMWYFLLRRGDHQKPIAIGNGGFKGRPSEDGTVEVGYSIVPEYQGRGLATEAVHALVENAFRHEDVSRVIAETFPELTPSIRVLEKCGFLRAGTGSAPGVLRFERALG